VSKGRTALAQLIAGGAGSAARVWIAFLLLLGLAAAPVFSTVLPPLLDYPNHLARMHLLAAGGGRFYAVRWAPLPNLAEDLFVPPLARLVPLETAGKLFLVAIFALTAGGAVFLNRVATGGWRLWPLAAFFLLYNRTLLWGFLNYLFGLGVWLCGLGLWLAIRERRPWLRILVSSLSALACFFSHLAAFGVYALTILGVELPGAAAGLRARDRAALARRAAILAAQFVIPAALLYFWRQTAGEAGVDYDFPRKFDLAFSVFDNYHPAFDIASFILFAGLLAWLGWTRRLGFEPRLGGALALLFVAYLAAPARLWGGSGLDHRLPLALFLLLVAGSAPSFPSRRAAVAVGVAAGLLLALRMAAVERVWLRADRIYAADLAGIDALPRGARLAVAYPANATHATAVPELHLPAMAVVRRDAFVPTLFALPGQQPLALRPRWAALAAEAQPPLLWTALVGTAHRPPPPLLLQFDAVALVGLRPPPTSANPCLKTVAPAPTFEIVRLRHRVGCIAGPAAERPPG
jgi:NADH:ubiquinone oxidoreductase subunit 6 (subunit J)